MVLKELRDGNNVQVGFRLGEATMVHTMLLFSKSRSLVRGKVG